MGKTSPRSLKLHKPDLEPKIALRVGSHVRLPNGRCGFVQDIIDSMLVVEDDYSHTSQNIHETEVQKDPL